MDNDEKWKYLIELARNNKANFEKDDKWLVKGCGIKLYLKPTYNFGRISSKPLDITYSLTRYLSAKSVHSLVLP